MLQWLGSLFNLRPKVKESAMDAPIESTMTVPLIEQIIVEHKPLNLTITNREYGTSSNKVVIRIDEGDQTHMFVYLYRYGYKDPEYGMDIWELLIGYPIDMIQYFLHATDLDNEYNKLSSMQLDKDTFRVQSYDGNQLTFILNEQEQKQFRSEIILNFESDLRSVYNNSLSTDEMAKFRKDVPELF